MVAARTSLPLRCRPRIARSHPQRHAFGKKRVPGRSTYDCRAERILPGSSSPIRPSATRLEAYERAAVRLSASTRASCRRRRHPIYAVAERQGPGDRPRREQARLPTGPQPAISVQRLDGIGRAGPFSQISLPNVISSRWLRPPHRPQSSSGASPAPSNVASTRPSPDPAASLRRREGVRSFTLDRTVRSLFRISVGRSSPSSTVRQPREPIRRVRWHAQRFDVRASSQPARVRRPHPRRTEILGDTPERPSTRACDPRRNRTTVDPVWV